jgi:hypothetical protein
MKKFKTPDILYFETDNSCALCGARGAHILTVHHIDEDRSHNTYDNLIVLCHNCHNPYHNPNCGEPTLVQIEERKRNLIHKTITTFGLNAMKIAKRNSYGVVAFPYMLYHLCELGYMKKEEAQMGYGEIDDATARFSITDLGISILDKWFTE